MPWIRSRRWPRKGYAVSPARSTSIEAYRKAVIDGRARSQRERIVLALSLLGPMTRWELHRLTGIRYTSVCGRVHALIQSKIARDDQLTRQNPDGGNEANVVELIHPRPKQRSFFR